MARRSRIILHGKQSANQELRDAVAVLREEGHEIEVRVTWEAGDSGLFAAAASKEGVDTVIAGGGDGFTPGGGHTCAVDDSAAVWCWGWNFAGGLGDGTTTDSASPVPVVGF